jgi:Xaa-Pro aminopeptidase
MSMNYSLRQQKAAETVALGKADMLVVTHMPNVRYLCGFEGSSGVLIVFQNKCTFITDGRYTEQAKQQVKNARVAITKGAALAAAAKLVERAGYTSIAIEAEHMTVGMAAGFKRLLPRKTRLRHTRGVVEQLRMLKEPEEIDRIRAAVRMGSDLLETGIRATRPGVAETQVAAELEFAARRAGADGMSFDTIVASGVRSALPHGRASNAPIARNGFVVMDFGVILAGYCSDMTRTIHVGRVPTDSRSIYEAVREAQQAAIDAVRPGVTVAAVDAAARTVLKRAGLARYFTHSTGHGVGLEIHESPRIARGVPDVVQAGMVITIEPGAYVPGKGGVRIEDMVLVTARGCEVLTFATKELVVV